MLKALVWVLMSLKDQALHFLPKFGYLPLMGPSEMDLHQAQEMLEHKCLQGGGEAAVLEATKAIGEVIECLILATNHTSILGIGRNGSLELYNRMCRLRSGVSRCGVVFSTAMEACMDADEKTDLEIVTNVSRALAEFVCSQLGHSAIDLALECVQLRQLQLRQCGASFATLVTKDEEPTVRLLPRLALSKQQCSSLEDSLPCVLHVLDTCHEFFKNIVDIVRTNVCPA
uniref:Uncharacterized protein n=1 Tax=Timema monikensis TaxID=170555 RepID=A0A7R9HQE2_9NEOP|nr:unnamed protein product [Timema monikensis]